MLMRKYKSSHGSCLWQETGIRTRCLLKDATSLAPAHAGGTVGSARKGCMHPHFFGSHTAHGSSFRQNTRACSKGTGL